MCVCVALSVGSTRARPGQQQPESAPPPPAQQPAQPTQSQTQQSQQQQQNGNHTRLIKIALYSDEVITSSGVDLTVASCVFVMFLTHSSGYRLA